MVANIVSIAFRVYLCCIILYVLVGMVGWHTTTLWQFEDGLELTLSIAFVCYLAREFYAIYREFFQ